jgi:hypothetical protein
MLKVLQWTPVYTKTKRILQKNYLSLWCWLQATDNLISDGFHLRNILREFLLRAANGNPIANKGQVHKREKGFN